ncbi:MAG TPA: ABC transporter substrate-binding protein [Bacillota bacterium]|jgi:peptide/nickel transport system substrate-binding protein|nr:hypothetical protein [Fastidiosipila sp.]HPX93335.1 ABC transporter substrate-binding protein [Bacillota bacterium]HQB80527.1 ABC transporter substrate-binding protein [Bacillota bacterium]
MSNKLIRKSLAFLLVAVMAFAVFGCAPKTPPEETGKPTETSAPPTTEAPPKEVLPDVPADRYDALATPRTGSNATVPLVVSTGTLDGKFNPFFYTSAYDADVVGMTQLGLLYYNKFGAPEAGIDVPSFAYEYSQDIEGDTSVYTFVLKNGIPFSDGTIMSAKDVLFSMYVLADPMYDGSSTFYTMDIQGIVEYRRQAPMDLIEKVDSILEAGYEYVDGEMVMNPVSGVSEDDQKAVWGYIDQAGARFAQSIVDYVYREYPQYIPAYFAPYTQADLVEDENKKVAFGMVMWGFGDLDDDDNFVDYLGNVYVFGEDEVTPEVYWENIVGMYGYDLEGINGEAAELEIEDFVKDVYFQEEREEGGGVPSISGITTGTLTSEDGVEREYIKIVLDGVDPTAIFKFGVAVVPFHYYTKGYAGELNDFGVDVGNKAFMDHLKTKNDKPVGAGPYIFEEFKDNVVTYGPNEHFLLGSPHIHTFRYQEITLGAELDSLKTGTVHYADPSASTTIVNDITAGEGEYAKLAYTLVDNDGYGYIGIQGQAVPEFEVRKALAHAMNVQLAVDDYYGELASVNYRTMTKVLWAYPENPENLFPYDETGEKSKELFLEAGYVYEDGVMKYPEGHEKEGQQVTFKFTLPSEAKDHPAGSIMIDTQEVLAKIGVKVDIEVDQNLLGKLNTAYDSGIQVWAAAWGGGGVDPDMFQIWYSDPKVNQQPPRAGLFYLYENGSDEEKAMLTRLNELIVAGRSTLDVEERKTIYKEALELSTGIAIEIPTYQRKNMFVYDKTVVDGDSLFSGEDVTPFQSPLSFIWNVDLLD